MIVTAYALAVQCNLCKKTGPALSYDQNKYRADVDENHPTSVYYRTINANVQKEAEYVGFKCLRPSSGLGVNDALHICLDCTESIVELIAVKPEGKAEEKVN